MKKLINKLSKKSVIFISLILVVLVCLFLNVINGKAVDSGDRIHFITSEYGDSMIIESNGHYGLIDSLNPSVFNETNYPYNGTTVLNYAKAIGVQYFDFVIMTHNHSDHIGGIPELAELFNDKTIVFYKEDKVSYNSNNVIDDSEELADNGTWKNHELYELAIQTFQSKNSILCDVTKTNQSVACNLSLAHNDYISSVTYNSNSNLSSGSNMKEYVTFRFGDFDVNLYNLYLISYHRENYNSIVTLLTHRTGGATAALTGDIETVLGDISATGQDDPDITYLSGKSNLILQPTGNCTECTTLGLENQMADIIGEVTLLKAAHHGNNTSNSIYALNAYKPKYYITQGVAYHDEHGVYPKSNSNAAQVIYLNQEYDTKSYLSAQATGAVVAQFNDDSSDTLAIYKNDYDSNNNIVSDNQIDRIGNYYYNGWGDLQNLTLNNRKRKWNYVRNNQPIIDNWYYSNDSWYYFGEDTLMKTGLFEKNGYLYYLSENYDTLGIMQTGWKYVDDYWYYFRPSNYPDGGGEGTAVLGFATIDGATYYLRTTENDGSTGPKASMIKGFATIDNNTYYFRDYKNEATNGPEGGMVTGLVTINNNLYYFRETNDGSPIGSALKNTCKNIDNANYCFDENGVGETVTLVSVPTTSRCLNPTYNDNAQTLASNQTGYTFTNNSESNAGSYTVTAVLDNGYAWSDYTLANKDIECSISKVNLPTPNVSAYEGVYDGADHQVSVSNASGKTVNYSTDSINYSSVIPTRSIVGTTNVYVKFIGNNNYNDSDVTTSHITISKATPSITIKDELNEVTEGYEGKLLTVSSNIDGIFTFSTEDSNLSITTGPTSVSAGEEIDLNVEVSSYGNYSINILFTPTSSTNYESYNTQKDFIANEIIIVPDIATIPLASDYCKSNLVYNDSEQTLTNAHGEGYTFTNNTATNAGNYTVSAVLDANYEWSDHTTANKTFDCTIEKANTDAPIIISYNAIFDGLEHQVTLSNQVGKTINYSTDGTNYSTTIPTRTIVGTTNVYVKYLGDQNHYDSDVSTGYITISKANSVITLSNINNEFTIGDESTLMSVSSDIGGIFTFSTLGDNVEITTGPVNALANEVINVNINAVKKGTSSVNITFVPTDSTNYNSYTHDEQVTVNNKVAIVPLANDYCKTNLIYNEDEQTLTNAHGEGYTFINNTGTNAGNYNVTAHLGNNYDWSDGTTSDKTIVCSISKVKHSAPIINNYVGTYDGSEHEVTLQNGAGKEVNYSTNGFDFSSTVPTRTNYGTTNVYVKYLEDLNHLESDVSTGSITVNKVETVISRTNDVNEINAGDESSILTLSSSVPGTFSFSLTDSSIELLSTSEVVSANQVINLNVRGISEGSASINIIFTPIDTTNHTSYIGSKTLTINPKIINYNTAIIPVANIYCKNNLVYNAQEQTLTNNHGEGYTFINNTGTNAGSYTITAVLDENYVWSDHTNEDKTVTCSIGKADLEIPTITGYSGVYDGNSHSINVSEISGGTIKYSLDGENYTTFVPSRTDVGNTLVYVKYTGDQNHNDSSVYSASINISKANSIISSMNLAEEIEEEETKEIGPIHANVPGIFAITSNDTSKLTVPVIYESVDKNEDIVVNITGFGVGTTSYTITFTPTSSNYNPSSITTDITVTEKAKTPVLIPTSSLFCKPNLKYTGSPLTITSDPEVGYTFSNNVQTNPGTYEVTATLEDGYIWSDNSSTDKTLSCTILNQDSYLTFSNNLTVSNNTIRPNLNPGITYTEIKSLIDTNGIVTSSKNDDELVATCDTLSITLGDVTTIYTFIINGDITRNGLASNDDVNLLFRYLRNKETLNECQLKASDTTHDSNLFINDVAKLYQFVNGTIGGLSD